MSPLLKIFSYSRCGTCRKALNWLHEKDIEYQLIDIINKPPSKKDLVTAVKQLGDIKYILNTSGKSYRAIGAASIKQMTNNEIIKLTISDSKLIKRPFAIHPEGKVLVGFNQLSWEQFFLS